MRILSIMDPETHEMFLKNPVHRFGGPATGPTDNWSGGGVTAPIDLATGELGRVVGYSRGTGIERHDNHPSSDARVAGTFVPQWNTIKATVREVAELHHPAKYVGWDVALTETGPMILEGNRARHSHLQQLGGGLLTDDRVVRFFDQHRYSCSP